MAACRLSARSALRAHRTARGRVRASAQRARQLAPRVAAPRARKRPASRQKTLRPIALTLRLGPHRPRTPQGAALSRPSSPRRAAPRTSETRRRAWERRVQHMTRIARAAAQQAASLTRLDVLALADHLAEGERGVRVHEGRRARGCQEGGPREAVTLTGLPCHRGCTRRANGRNDACGGLAALLRLLGRGIRRPSQS